MWDFNGEEPMTLAESRERLAKLEQIYVRLSKRRNVTKIPKDFTIVDYPYGVKKTEIVRWIDKHTSGGFYFKDKVVAFHRKDEAEMFFSFFAYVY